MEYYFETREAELLLFVCLFVVAVVVVVVVAIEYCGVCQGTTIEGFIHTNKHCIKATLSAQQISQICTNYCRAHKHKQVLY